MINSKNKGARGERSWRDKLREHGFQADRGQQYKGTDDSPDVDSPELPFHWEVKNTQALRLWPALAQAERECGLKTAVVAFKRNRGPWYVALSADDFLNLVRRSDLL